MLFTAFLMAMHHWWVKLVLTKLPHLDRDLLEVEHLQAFEPIYCIQSAASKGVIVIIVFLFDRNTASVTHKS